MTVSRSLTICVTLLLTAASGAFAEAVPRTLLAYGPGGPHHVLKECAELYEEKHGVAVAVVKARPNELVEKLGSEGDLYYGGAEFMLEEFAQNNPGILDLHAAEKLYPRRIGIVVRKGNPLDIDGTHELNQAGVNLLTAQLEKMGQFHAPPAAGGSTIRRSVFTGQDGVAAWLADPELDAWITYRSWHVALKDHADFIEIPGDDALRHTVITPTRRTPYREAALHFIDFLKSPEARQIFEEHGWD